MGWTERVDSMLQARGRRAIKCTGLTAFFVAVAIDAAAVVLLREAPALVEELKDEPLDHSLRRFRVATLTTIGLELEVEYDDGDVEKGVAEEMIRGEKTDVGVWPMALELEDGRILQGAAQADTFFTTRYWWFPEGETEPVQWPIPPKSSPEGVYQGQLLVSLQEDWAPKGQETAFKSGDLVAFNIDSFMETRELPPVSLVFHPSETQALEGVSIARGALLLGVSDTAVGKVMRATATEAGWTLEPIALPGTGQANIAFAMSRDDLAGRLHNWLTSRFLNS